MGRGVKQVERHRGPQVAKRAPGQRSAGARRRAAFRQRAVRMHRLKAYGIPAAVIVVVVIVAVAISLGGSGATAGPVTVAGSPRAAPLAPGEAIPDFSANLLGGGSVRWSDYRGTPTVLAIWAPWCPHCQRELPILSGVMQEFPAAKLLTIVTAVRDRPGPMPQEYLDSRHLHLATALDDTSGTLASAFGLRVFPLVYYVDAGGVVRQVVEGESPPNDIRANLRLILGE